MTTNQEARQIAIRDVTSTTGNTSSDWHALFDDASIAAGPFNARMLAWINDQLGTSYTNLPGAMHAYAVGGGFSRWSDINDLATATVARTLVDTWSSDGQGWAASFEGAAPSIYVKDTGTPANDNDITLGNDFDAFSAFLTKTAVTPKITRQADGYYKYQAHNLYLNSGSPADQSVTVVSGMPYKIVVTGSVSITLSGAATGTVTAGNDISFMAATTTLTCGSTSGSGTVHLFLTPAVESYLATTSTARYALPIQYNAAGVAEGLLIEAAATNLVTYSNDLTNAAWTKSNMTTAKTATGPGGDTNGATICTATAGNATALFSITSTSAARVTSVFLKRRTGSGNIDITQDNGSTWTTQAVTSTWTRFELATVTSADPTVGLRIVTSGDAVDVALFDHELGSVTTSPIITAGATLTRTADQLAKVAGLPLSVTAATMYIKAQRPAKDSFSVFMTQYGTPDTNQITLRDSSAALSGIVRNASAGVTMDLGNPTDNPVDTDFKFAIAAEANNGNVAIGGTAKTADTSVTMPANASGIRFHSGAGYSGASMLLKEVLYLPERLSDADLESLTT